MKSSIEISLLALTFSTSKYSNGMLRNNKEEDHASAFFLISVQIKLEDLGLKINCEGKQISMV